MASGDNPGNPESLGRASELHQGADISRGRRNGLVRGLAASAGVFVLICGCAAEGDFGRPKPSLIHQNLNDKVSYVRDFIMGGSPRFALTADELELRDAAYYFNESLPVHALGVRPLLEGGTYADHLTASGYKIGRGQIDAISEHLRADHYWFRRLARAVRSILNADAERQAQLRISSHVLSDNDRARVFARIKENRLLIHTALRDLSERLAAYGYAIERSRIEHPGAKVRDVERSLDGLRQRTSNLRTEIAKFQRYVSPRPWDFRPVRSKSHPANGKAGKKGRNPGRSSS